MKGPVSYYFGIYRTDIFVKNWTMLLKNTTEGQCHEDCWVVNNIAPRNFTPVKSASCVGSIGYSENRELFTLLYDARIVHYNSGLCVISGYNKNVILENCNRAAWARDGRHKFNFYPDGRITPYYAKDECLYKPINIASEEIATNAIVEATSEIADAGHDAPRVVDGDEDSYWASNPGDVICTLTLYFKQWMSMNDLILNWKYRADNYEVYAYTLENGWKNILRVSGNTLNKNRLDLKRINARAIQIKMNTSKQKFLGKIIYGLASVQISDGAFNLKRKRCSDIGKNLKEWILDDQWYYYVGNKPPYMKAYNRLSKTVLKLRKLNRLINTDFIYADKAHEKAKQISQLLVDTNKKLTDLLNKIKVYKTERYAKKNVNFEDILRKFHLAYFYPYFPKPINNNSLPQIGSVVTAPGKDCWHIKQLIPYKKSGLYWIKPRCTPKAIRVWCDFSIDKLGTSIFAWKSDSTTINTPIVDVQIESVKDVQKQCASFGLYPIELHNKNVVTRVTQYLETIGYKMSLPLVFPLGYDWGCDVGKCKLAYRSLNSKQSKRILSFFPYPDKNVWRYNRIQKFSAMGMGYSKDNRPYFFNFNNVKIGALVCSTNEHVPPLADPTEASLQCSDVLSGNGKIDGSIGTKIKINCPSFCKEKSKAKFYGKGTYSDNSSICRAALHDAKITDNNGGSAILVIGPSYSSYKASEQNGMLSSKYTYKTNKSFTFESDDEKCPIDYYKSDEEEADEKQQSQAAGSPQGGQSGATAGNEEGSNQPKVTSVPTPPQKIIPFSNQQQGSPASYNPPQPKPLPTDKSKNNGGINYNFFKMMETKNQIKESDELENLERMNERFGEGSEDENNGIFDSIKNAAKSLKNKATSMVSKAGSKIKNAALNAKKALNKNKLSSQINNAKQAANPSSNPQKSKNEKKAAAKKKTCVLNTDTCTREITDFRRQDYKAFKAFEQFGAKMSTLIKEFKSEYAFGQYPGKLSNKHFESKCIFLIV